MGPIRTNDRLAAFPPAAIRIDGAFRHPVGGANALTSHHHTVAFQDDEESVTVYRQMLADHKA